jgi:hypothetical protein
MVADAFPPFLLRSTGSGNIVTVYERRNGQCGMAAGPAARSNSRPIEQQPGEQQLGERQPDEQRPGERQPDEQRHGMIER